MNRRDFSFLKLFACILGVLLAAFVFAKTVLHAEPKMGLNINVCLGTIAALLVIPRLNEFSPKVRWDKMLGLFSFPLFLCHESAFNILYNHKLNNPALLLLAAILLSAILIVVVEIPSDRIRYRLRHLFQKPVAS
jgi:peptidoglycan/LPS O-acetylase OafA/YrhL